MIPKGQKVFLGREIKSIKAHKSEAFSNLPFGNDSMGVTMLSKGIEPLILFKMLVLQRVFNLSYDKVNSQANDS